MHIFPNPVTIVTKSLQNISGLTKLHISDNNITSKAANEVAAAICCNTKLEEFDLSGNNLRTQGVIEIAIALQNVVTLTKLNMSNTNITNEAANSISLTILIYKNSLSVEIVLK